MEFAPSPCMDPTLFTEFILRVKDGKFFAIISTQSIVSCNSKSHIVRCGWQRGTLQEIGPDIPNLPVDMEGKLPWNGHGMVLVRHMPNTARFFPNRPWFIAVNPSIYPMLLHARGLGALQSYKGQIRNPVLSHCEPFYQCRSQKNHGQCIFRKCSFYSSTIHPTAEKLCEKLCDDDWNGKMKCGRMTDDGRNTDGKLSVVDPNFQQACYWLTNSVGNVPTRPFSSRYNSWSATSWLHSFGNVPINKLLVA